jgi:uncharacterized protein
VKLLTTDLDAGEIRLQTTANPKAIPALAALHEAGEVRFEHPLAVDLRAFRSRDMIAVQGRLTTRVKLACARCLVLHLEDLDLAFELSYLQNSGPVTAEADDETEIDADEAGLMRFEGDTIDLSEGIGEQIIMGLPFKPLCDSDCKGLCSQCGVNLNHADCTCAPSSPDSPFAVLKQLQGQVSEG